MRENTHGFPWNMLHKNHKTLEDYYVLPNVNTLNMCEKANVMHMSLQE